MNPLTLMAVHAHPDDEASSTGGVLAKYSDEGVRTIVVTCTNGEFGDGPAGIKPGADGHDKADVAVGQLSGGEMARLMLALVSRKAPHLLVLDEPEQRLDARGRAWLTARLLRGTAAGPAGLELGGARVLEDLLRLHHRMERGLRLRVLGLGAEAAVLGAAARLGVHERAHVGGVAEPPAAHRPSSLPACLDSGAGVRNSIVRHSNCPRQSMLHRLKLSQ